MNDVDQQDRFVRELEAVIRTFEPRFRQLSVTMNDHAQKFGKRTFSFRIEGTLYAEPEPEYVSFDSSLEPDSRSFQITGGDGV